MKSRILFLAFFSFSHFAFSQQDTLNEQRVSAIKGPNEEVGKTYYEFDGSKSYKLFNQAGDLVKEGTSQKVDVTDLPKGNYFFSYDSKTVLYKKE